MSDVVFILGAGASQLCGAPLMNDFLDRSRELLASGKIEDKQAHFEKVFKAISNLQVAHSKAILDLNNIESIFNVLEMSKILQKFPGFESSEIENVISSLKEVIVSTLDNSIVYPVIDNFVRPPKPYEEFAEALSHIRSNRQTARSVSVITFNYDIALDIALHLSKLPYDYYLGDIPQGFHIPLLKLHGSLNWAVCAKCGKIIPWYLLEDISAFRLQAFPSPYDIMVPIGSEITNVKEHCNTKVQAQPFLVPPTWNKGDHYQALSKVWSRAAFELSEAEYIFVIGYSMPETDSFFKMLYALGAVGSNLIRSIVVFNPDESGRVDSRFKNILGPGAIDRYKFEKHTFKQAIPMIRAMFPRNY